MLKKMENRLLGGVLLISGTSIGAGMLALPITTGFGGFIPSLFFLLAFWLFMLLTAFLLLEVNLQIKGTTNMVGMAEHTLGFFGKALCWSAYLLLLYCLNAAYISGSAPILIEGVNLVLGVNLPEILGPFLLLAIFGLFIYLGTHFVDYLNRFFILGLMITYVALLFFLPSHVNLSLFAHRDFSAALVGVPIIITSFGFHIIIPSLTTYLRHDVKKLRWALVIGSLIPLIIYLLWEGLTLGVVPLQGDNSLSSAWAQGKSVTFSLAKLLQNRSITLAAHLFSFFAIITSFLGVSLSLADFLTDGLKIKKTGKGRLIASLFTFIPPLIFVLVYQKGFVVALQYAGAFVAILLGILPALMAWTLPKPSFFSTLWGRVVLVTVLVISLFVVMIDLLPIKEIFLQKYVSS